VDFKVLASGIGVALVLIYAFGSGIWVNTSPGWYTSLNQPLWQPPDFIFGLIWPYNFFVIAFASIQIAQKQSRLTAIFWLVTLALSITAALIWAYQFYVPHNLNLASYALLTTALLTLPLTYLAYKTSWKIGALFTPYQLWVITAATLSFSYAARN
jgi:benzodiazapine receptor